MTLFILLFLYCVITSQNVLCLDCYATDLHKLASGKLDAPLQDCRSNLEELFKLQRRPAPSASELERQELRCFKVEALAGSNSTVIKGCTPEGGCELMKAVFKIALASQKAKHKVSSMECYECKGNKCNGSTSLEMNYFSAIILVLITFYLNDK